jgi:hypothetical protein
MTIGGDPVINTREMRWLPAHSPRAWAALAVLGLWAVAWAQPSVGAAKTAGASPSAAAQTGTRAQDLLARAALDNVAVVHGRSVGLRTMLGRSASTVIGWQNTLASREASIFATSLPFSAPVGSSGDAATSIVHFGGPRGSHTTLRMRAGALTSSGAGQSTRSLVATAQLVGPRTVSTQEAASAWTASERPLVDVTIRRDEVEWNCPGTNRQDGIASAEDTGSFTVTRHWLGLIPIETRFTVDLKMEAYANDDAALRDYYGHYVFSNPGGGSYEGRIAGQGKGVALKEGEDSNNLRGYLGNNARAAADVASAVRDWARVETHSWAQRAFGEWYENGGCLTVQSGVKSGTVQPTGVANLSLDLIAPLVGNTGKKGKHRAPKPHGTVNVSTTGSIRATPTRQRVTGNKPFKIKITSPLDSTTSHAAKPGNSDDPTRADRAADGADTVTVQAQTDDGRAQLVIPVQPVLPVATVTSLTSDDTETASGPNGSGDSHNHSDFVSPDTADEAPTDCEDDVCAVSLAANVIATDSGSMSNPGEQCSESSGPEAVGPYADQVGTLYLHYSTDGDLISADVQSGPFESIGAIVGGQTCIVALGDYPVTGTDVPVSTAALDSGQPVTVAINGSGSGPLTQSIPQGMTMSSTYSLSMTFTLNGPLVQDITLPDQPSPSPGPGS